LFGILYPLDSVKSRQPPPSSTSQGANAVTSSTGTDVECQSLRKSDIQDLLDMSCYRNPVRGFQLIEHIG
jgi:hypothetical protein